MRKSVTEYIKFFEKTLDMSGVCWWIIDFKENPNNYYCNRFMEDTFYLDKSLKFHSIEETCPIAGDYNKNIELACETNENARLVIDEYKDLLSGKVEEYNNKFPYYSEDLKQTLYFSSRAKVLERSENNEVSILYGIIEDITLQEAQKQKIKEYTDIIDQYVITSYINIDGTISDVSKAFCETSGYTKDELIGKRCDLLSGVEMYQHIVQTIKNESVWRGESKNIAKDGSEYWLFNIISPNYDANGLVKGYTHIGQNISDKKVIEKSAQIDQLTKIYNRMKLDEVIEYEYKTSKRYATKISLIILDIDFFKSINDKHGHLVGDRILIQFANLLKKNLRISDTVGRWGGEEFIIVCANSSGEVAKQLAQKLKKIIESFIFDTNAHVTASFGVAEFKTSDSINSLIGRADEALYKAKESGRNQVILSNDELLHIEQELDLKWADH